MEQEGWPGQIRWRGKKHFHRKWGLRYPTDLNPLARGLLNADQVIVGEAVSVWVVLTLDADSAVHGQNVENGDRRTEDRKQDDEEKSCETAKLWIVPVHLRPITTGKSGKSDGCQYQLRGPVSFVKC